MGGLGFQLFFAVPTLPQADFLPITYALRMPRDCGSKFSRHRGVRILSAQPLLNLAVTAVEGPINFCHGGAGVLSDELCY